MSNRCRQLRSYLLSSDALGRFPPSTGLRSLGAYVAISSIRTARHRRGKDLRGTSQCSSQESLISRRKRRNSFPTRKFCPSVRYCHLVIQNPARPCRKRFLTQLLLSRARRRTSSAGESQANQRITGFDVVSARMRSYFDLKPVTHVPEHPLLLTPVQRPSPEGSERCFRLSRRRWRGRCSTGRRARWGWSAGLLDC